MKSLFKNINLFTQDDITSLTLNPHAAKPMSSGLQGGEDDAEGNTENKKMLNYERFPPTLICQLCSTLMKDAVLVPCCQVTCCFDCIQQKIVKQLNLRDDKGVRIGCNKCPICKDKKLSLANIIPNLQMRNIIKWFEKQRAYRAKIYTIDLQKK